MNIRSAKFSESNTAVEKCPAPNMPEYAFCGRSNVGKSSLINMLLNVKGIAKISSTPGKTQLINHFLVNEEFYFADLPGYGYAKSSKDNRETWKTMVQDFLKKRANLMCLFLLIDSRIEPQKKDLDFIYFLGENGIPFVLVFTKTDKISLGKLQSSFTLFKNKMLEQWEVFPTHFFTSSENRNGRTELLDFIETSNKLFDKKKIVE